MIYVKLRELKAKSGMSVQQIAEKSGVPASTISRILSGQTDSPGCQTIVDLVRAMGGSLDEMMGLYVEKVKELEKGIESAKEEEIPKLEKITEPEMPKAPVKEPENRKDIDALIQLYERGIANKNRTIKYLAIGCAILMAVLVVLILYLYWDVTHPHVGSIFY